jgi:hypothetical protein
MTIEPRFLTISEVIEIHDKGIKSFLIGKIITIQS